MKSLRMYLIAGSLLVLATITGIVLAGDPDPGSASVNFTVMNKSTTDTAAVVAQYVDQSGVVQATVEEDVDPLSSQGFPITTSGLADGFLGSAIVSSDQPVTAFAQMRWTGGANGDGNTAGAYNGFDSGVTTLYFPSLKAIDGSQFSVVAIQSAEAASSSDTIDFDITFYDRDGNVSGSLTSQTINKGAQMSIDLLDDISLGDNWNGSAVATSSSPLAGVATTHWSEYSTAYSGVSGGGTVAYIPEARRRGDNDSSLEQFAGVVVQNLESGSSAEVTVFWYDRSGTLLHEFDDTIAANSAKGYNTKQNANTPDPAALHDDLGLAWNGSVVISSTNGANIVAVTNLQWSSDSGTGAAATSFVSAANGSNTLLFPASFRVLSGTTYNQYTGVIIQNVGDSACTNYSVTWRDRDGNTLLSYTDSLDPSTSSGYNTRFGADLNDLGEDPADLGDEFRGSIVVEGTGSCELAGIHNTVWPSFTDSTSYQGVSGD